MAWVPGGAFLMGSDGFYPEERPAHRVMVDGFWMDEHPVTNAGFHCFVEATGYVTAAERAPDPAGYPGVDPALHDLALLHARAHEQRRQAGRLP